MANINWKKDEIKLGIKLINEGDTFHEIAEKLNRSYNSVRGYFNRKGFKTLTKSIKHITCVNCGIECLKYEYIDNKKKRRIKFCSQSCSVSYSNKTREKKDKNFSYCLNCENICKTNNSKYCCQKCQFEYQNKILIEKIKNNNIKGLSERVIKKALIIIYGEKCMKCGWNEVNEKTGKVPIELNHKDGNSENNDNKNTELLCPNCHSLTPNYRGLNKGNGRYKRRQRARDGKSY